MPQVQYIAKRFAPATISPFLLWPNPDGKIPAGKLAGFFMRFTIRDVLTLMLILGLSLGWTIDHRRQASTAERLRYLLDNTLGKYNENDPEPYIQLMQIERQRSAQNSN